MDKVRLGESGSFARGFEEQRFKSRRCHSKTHASNVGALVLPSRPAFSDPPTDRGPPPPRAWCRGRYDRSFLLGSNGCSRASLLSF